MSAGGAKEGGCRVCAGLRPGRSPQGKWEAWPGSLPRRGLVGGERPTGSRTAASSGAGRVGPSRGERKAKWGRGRPRSGADRHGSPLPLPAYWTDGQVEKQTHGQADCKRKEQDAGVPLLLHNRKCHRHHQSGRGRGGEGPLSTRGGQRGGREHQFCPARGRRAGMAERRWGWAAPKPPSHSVQGEVPECNKGSGRPGRPHWGVRFLFCTRNLSWWGRPRGGCRAGLFSETRERRRKGTKGWGWRAGTRQGEQ